MVFGRAYSKYSTTTIRELLSFSKSGAGGALTLLWAWMKGYDVLDVKCDWVKSVLVTDYSILQCSEGRMSCSALPDKSSLSSDLFFFVNAILKFCVIPDFRCDMNKIHALLGFYAALIDSLGSPLKECIEAERYIWEVSEFWLSLFNKSNRRTIFPNLLFQEILFVSGTSSAHHQEFFTVHSTLIYVIKHAWYIPVPNVQWKAPDDGQRNCRNM